MQNRIMIAALGMTLALAPVRAQETQDHDRVAAALGLSRAEVSIEATGRRDLRGLGKTVLRHKVRLPDGTMTTVDLDAAGAPVDLEALEAAEAAATDTDAAKVHPLLRREIEDGTADSVHRVAVWFHFAEIPDVRTHVTERVKGGMKADDARLEGRELLKQAVGPVVQAGRDTLSAQGLVPMQSDDYCPVVFTEATDAQIAALAALPNVARIFPSLAYETEIDDAISTHRMDVVHRHGVRGTGIKVAIVEADGASNSHPDLNVVGYANSNPTIGSHPTAIAGIIGSSSTTFPGHARGVETYSANAESWLDADLISAMTWAANQGVSVMNLSFGFDTDNVMALLDTIVDYHGRHNEITMIKSCGNRGLLDGDCTSPGLGWNILAVGNVNESGNGDWDDDTMNSQSSYNDPVSPHNDREKPELCAVGTGMTSTTTGGGYGYVGSGTSYAAPGVAGLAAVLMQMDSSLTIQPELTRAVLMASANHNIEGASRLSDKDGAGCINALAAFRVVDRRQVRWGTLTPSSFSNNGYYTLNMNLRAGDRTRVCLNWSSTGNFLFSPNVLDADLDLSILAPGGAYIAGSFSWDNSYEIVEFVPQVTGTYTIRINDWRFDGTSEPFGVAWSQHADGRHVDMRPTLPDSALDNSGPILGNGNFGMHARDRINPGHTVVCFASAGQVTGVPLPDGRLVYGNSDFLSAYSTDPTNTNFFNFVGAYNTAGHYGAYSMAVPDLPVLAGLPMYFTALTIDPAAPSAIKEISDLEEVVMEDHSIVHSLTDDGSTQITLPWGFPFYGSTHFSLWLNANGNVTFGGPSSDYTESVTDLTSGLPRIAALWDDLNPANGGVVRTREAGDRFIIEWVDVPQFGQTDENSVKLVLHQNGDIEIFYLDVDSNDSIVGVSPGANGGTSKAWDLTDGHGYGFSSGALYEQFFGLSPFDMSTQWIYRTKVTFERRPLIFFGVTYDVRYEIL